jgi:hypothetical protein
VKSFVLITLLYSFSAAGLATDETLLDIAKIARSREVSEFLRENNFRLKSLAYHSTDYCPGKPSSYILSVENRNGKFCDVWVRVGECTGDRLRERVSLIKFKAGLMCQ